MATPVSRQGSHKVTVAVRKTVTGGAVNVDVAVMVTDTVTAGAVIVDNVVAVQS